ncbi:hypothetical protein CL619_05095 [archaeon]|nr:hypothetical protein [archaeon]|tara:strand:+ start:2316 stop:2759 length:444 start_codon:yes stop_codon:yes gene_type:complete
MQERLSLIRAALEEHLSAINENSNEIQALFDYLQEMDSKIDSLHSRLDSMQIDSQSKTHEVKPLNEAERQVFVVLYTAESFLGYTEISARCGLSASCVQEHLRSLTAKGIPLTRTLSDKQILVQIDVKFKERQAKENVVNLSLDTFF